jgi:hypothetical protein
MLPTVMAHKQKLISESRSLLQTIVNCEQKYQEAQKEMEKLNKILYDICPHKWEIDRMCREERTSFVCDLCGCTK